MYWSKLQNAIEHSQPNGYNSMTIYITHMQATQCLAMSPLVSHVSPIYHLFPSLSGHCGTSRFHGFLPSIIDCYVWAYLWTLCCYYITDHHHGQIMYDCKSAGTWVLSLPANRKVSSTFHMTSDVTDYKMPHSILCCYRVLRITFPTNYVYSQQHWFVMLILLCVLSYCLYIYQISVTSLLVFVRASTHISHLALLAIVSRIW